VGRKRRVVEGRYGWLQAAREESWADRAPSAHVLMIMATSRLSSRMTEVAWGGEGGVGRM
jgi:hypothetical protein